jgi:hypothetical protein
MTWKLMIIAVLVFTFTSCGGGGPKSDADTLCNCGDEMVQLIKDGASEDELDKKDEECENMYKEFQEKYKNDEVKLKEFEDAVEICGDRIEEEIDQAIEERED